MIKVRWPLALGLALIGIDLGLHLCKINTVVHSEMLTGTWLLRCISFQVFIFVLGLYSRDTPSRTPGKEDEHNGCECISGDIRFIEEVILPRMLFYSSILFLLILIGIGMADIGTQGSDRTLTPGVAVFGALFQLYLLFAGHFSDVS